MAEKPLAYATRLATVLWEKHWKAESPNWRPENGLLGVLLQIDNMTAGLIRTSKLEPFAALGGGADMPAFHDLPDDTVIYSNSGAAITAGDVRAARTALRPPH